MPKSLVEVFHAVFDPRFPSGLNATPHTSPVGPSGPSPSARPGRG